MKWYENNNAKMLAKAINSSEVRRIENMIHPEDYYMFNLFNLGLLKRKVNMEKKDERQRLEKFIRYAQAAIEEAKSSLSELEVTYSTGDRFYGPYGKYMLVSNNDDCYQVQLCNLANSCYYDNSYKVVSPDKITQEEMNKIAGNGTFTRYWDSQKKIYTGDKK